VVGLAAVEEEVNPDKEWETWQGWLGREPTGDTIYAQVVEMLAFRQIWDAFVIVHDDAPTQARKDGTFLVWLQRNYARSQGVTVRRLTDPSSDVVSLARLIDSVWRYPTVASRDRFRALQSDQDFPMIDGWFHDLAGSGDYIDPRIPAQDFSDLRTKTAKIRKWVNTSVAHLSAQGRPLGTPPIQDLHDSIDVVAGLFRKYMNLIQGVPVNSGVVITPWPIIFRASWIRDDDHFQSIMTKVREAEEARRQPDTT
jgi:hypothetical protein